MTQIRSFRTELNKYIELVVEFLQLRLHKLYCRYRIKVLIGFLMNCSFGRLREPMSYVIYNFIHGVSSGSVVVF